MSPDSLLWKLRSSAGRLVATVVAFGLITTLAGAGCGGAAKQTNTDTNTGANSGDEGDENPEGGGSESQPSQKKK
jgi:hypothetical protein